MRPEQTPPARPHHRFTEDGRRMREVLSYSRRGNRFTPSQREAWDTHHESWVIPDEAVDEPGFRLAAWFGREAPLVVEIGSGVGEATGVLAAARPAYDVLALEVWRPGVAASLAEVAAAGAENVRFCSVDAVWAVEHLVAEGSIAELWTFFPDPWHKKKHNKRRLIQAPFVKELAARLAPGGYLHCATDWQPYAEQMLEVLGAEPTLANTANGYAERPDWRPLTKFENRGIKLGHGVWDLVFTRR
jgi:tRNA (guanine-N7-)-methyltransferase